MASSTNSPTSATAPLPTFLSQDPYPSQARDGRPTSSASVATDATSEFGTEDYTSAKERHSTMTGMTGPVGEPGLPPSRPISAGTSVVSSQAARAGKRESLQPPPSRKGLFGKDGGSRPGSSVSKTHVPTLTAQGFWRPLSSSKLQAQRNQNAPQATAGAAQTGASSAGPLSDATSQRSRRYSNASLNTLRDAKAASIKGGKSKENADEMPPLPASRGTQFTNEATVASESSATPLHNQHRTNMPATLQVNGLRSSNTPSEGRSPRSLRASLGMGSRNSRQDNDRRPSPKHHEKLDSNPSSPQYVEKPEMPVTYPKQPVPATGKNYEYFAGNTLFFLSGRCMNTRARPLNVATFILTALPAVLFFAFSAPWLSHNVSPAIPIIFAYVSYVTISSFLHAALSDPGLLPRNLQPHPPNPEEEHDPLVLGPATTEWVMVKTFPAPSRSPLPGRPNGSAEAGAGNAQAMEVPTKYCKSCNIWRPPRAHHCRVCDACIETQDHHCVWLNNCVGRRNYRFFFSYVAFGSLLAFLLLAFSLTHVGLYAQKNNISFSASLAGRTQEKVAFAMFIYAIVALPYPGSLFGYHLFLIARGETTREYLNSHKFLKKDRHRPFAQASAIRNWMAVLLRPRPPTYLRFKHEYQLGDVRMGYMVPKNQRTRNLKNRYSTTGPPSGATNGNAAGMEMKSLPPLPPNTGSTIPQAIKPEVRAPTTGNGGGLVDRTPR